MIDRLSPRRWIGIDFSGDVKKWTSGCRRSNVWVAELEENTGKPIVRSLHRVQELTGAGPPFARLVGFLRSGAADGVGIDAPFSIPQAYLPDGGRAQLLAAIRAIPRDKRPFPKGQHLLAIAEAVRSKDTAKPMRATEQHWREHGINVRSTLWNGSRGGAPFTIACLQLIAEADLRCWPWQRDGKPLLVEAFPAAQLRHWRIQYGGYDQDPERRLAILSALEDRVEINLNFRAIAGNSADALDAILCAFAGRAAVVTDCLAIPTPEDVGDEGWIAVHV